jgi:phosphoglycolate phosphatase
MKSVIFDLDGTLADTSGDLIAAANACFQRLGHGKMLDPVLDQEVAFNGGRAMLRLGFSRLGVGWSEGDTDAQYPQLLENYGNKIDVYTKLYDGVVPMLDQLAAEGFGLGVCTNKPAALAETLLARLGIRGHFGAMLGADSLCVRKPDPEHLFATIRALGGQMDQSVLIGDTITDRKTALNAKIPCVLVTFGPKSRDVVAMNPDALLEHYSDLPNVLTRLNLRP